VASSLHFKPGQSVSWRGTTVPLVAYLGLALVTWVAVRRARVKILTWDNGGFIVFYKRLEQGRFRRIEVSDDARVAHLDGTQLAMLLDGIDVSRVRRPKKWNPPTGDRLSQQSLISTARWQSDAPAGSTTASGARSTPRSRPTSRR
jgi:hypothetical protein